MDEEKVKKLAAACKEVCLAYVRCETYKIDQEIPETPGWNELKDALDDLLEIALTSALEK